MKGLNDNDNPLPMFDLIICVQIKQNDLLTRTVSNLVDFRSC